jgi:hypothetical protein
VEVVSLLLFVGALWGLCAIGLFAWSLLNVQSDHADRLAILPLEDNWSDAHVELARSSQLKEGHVP